MKISSNGVHRLFLFFSLACTTPRKTQLVKHSSYSCIHSLVLRTWRVGGLRRESGGRGGEGWGRVGMVEAARKAAICGRRECFGVGKLCQEFQDQGGKHVYDIKQLARENQGEKNGSCLAYFPRKHLPHCAGTAKKGHTGEWHLEMAASIKNKTRQKQTKNTLLSC